MRNSHVRGSTQEADTGYGAALEAPSTATLRRARHLLVPADICSDSAGALRWARRLAEQNGAEIGVVYGLESMADLKDEAADLIIISTSGRSGRALMEKVMSHAPCPVLVVGRNGTQPRLGVTTKSPTNRRVATTTTKAEPQRAPAKAVRSPRGSTR